MKESYNVMGDPDDGDDWRNINIAKPEGSWDIATPKKLVDKVQQPLNTWKVNIETKYDLNFTNVRYYWDEETMVKIIDLLHEFRDFFSTKFDDMKGIWGNLREMRIPLKPDVKSVKQHPYWLNTW